MKTNFKKYGTFAIALVIANLFFALHGFGQTVVITNPTSPWTVPAGVTSIKVEVWGGGGGGGGTFFGNGGGGGGGAYNAATFSVTAGHTFTITIGAGGTGGSFGNGGTGGPTTVTGVDGAVSANGGGGGGYGVFSSNSGNGAAGTAATGAHNGGAGGAASGNGAGGGGGAGNNGDGTDGSNTGNGSGGGGNPNSTPYKGGDGGAFRSSNGTGSTGIAPGGGGGGGKNSGGSNSGGVGGAGRVVITYSACGSITASATKNDISCFNTSTGQIIVTGSGGTSPYMFSIDNTTNYNATLVPGASYVPIDDTHGKFINLPIGTYKIRVKDANGCESKQVQ